MTPGGTEINQLIQVRSLSEVKPGYDSSLANNMGLTKVFIQPLPYLQSKYIQKQNKNTLIT